MDAQKVAVIGAGVSGLTAAWLLNRIGKQVTLFEKDEICGGHTLTDDTAGYPVDLGFQVYNLTTYPNFVGLLEELGVDTEQSDMSFALSAGKLEWGSDGVDAIFAQRRNLLSLSFWVMLCDVIRFGRQAPAVLKPEVADTYAQMTLGEYLAKHRYSESFRDNYVLPMCAAVWSVPNAQVLAFPVVMLVRFWLNHHLLDLVQRPVWRVVKDRSRSYVHKILQALPDVRTGVPVVSVKLCSGGRGPVCVTTADGQTADFDAVVLATHSDVSLALLGDESPEGVRPLLAAIPYNSNDVYLHTDDTLMPVNRKTWSSWNFIGSAPSATSAVCVTYWINRLQRLPAGAPPTFVTLNPARPPAPDKVLRRLALAHPVFSFASYKAQADLAAVQGRGGVYYAGAWCGYGFHEDGVRAGMAAAQALGAPTPWRAISTSPKIPIVDRFFMSLFNKFARVAVTRGHLRIILPSGEELSYGAADSIEPEVPEGEAWRRRPQLRATIRLLDCAFFRKVVMRHDTGMGESYMDGDFKVDNLGALMAIATANAGGIESRRGLLGPLNWVGDKLLLAAHLARPNTLQGSRRNIEEHYDAGNDMYKLFLDRTMTYSGAIYKQGDDLETAQLNKLDALIARAGLQASDHVLEIGCGWGSLAIRAAAITGCRVTGLTLSKEQLSEASQRVARAGLADKITLLLCDYRDCPGAGSFDKVLSCEMIEAVGHEHLPSYFSTISRMLKPAGTAVIQVITEPEERYEAYCRSSDFIRAHIFPGGHLPSMGAMVEAARGSGLQVQGCKDIGLDYALTLRAWRAAWEAEQARVLSLGYSLRFWRKYRFYFALCEAAFEAKFIHNYHVTWVKGPVTATLDTTSAPHPRADRSQSDPILQVLLAVYFFLAGVLVSRSPLLWIMPLASAACAALTFAVSTTLHRFSATYRRLPRDGRSWWSTDIVHVLYSGCMFVVAAGYVISQPSALDIHWVAPPGPASRLPTALICVAAGFFGFQLWTLVHHRLYRHAYPMLIHFTILLGLFASTAYKNSGAPLLATTLLSEISSVFFVLGKLQNLAGMAHASRLRRAVRTGQLVTIPLTRVIPHAVFLASVLYHPGAFSSQFYYYVTLCASVYINISNARALLLVVLTPQQHKQHAA
ncbi:hypothetical protein WJX72_007777 [[Myrmecia] bisecta]|uniref:TLC domain-containing protein n=1 Tax=[Myrmecia] bisecta TaxID=41462 RepID=A0AAW1QC67_9CHLO